MDWERGRVEIAQLTKEIKAIQDEMNLRLLMHRLQCIAAEEGKRARKKRLMRTSLRPRTEGG